MVWSSTYCRQDFIASLYRSAMGAAVIPLSSSHDPVPYIPSRCPELTQLQGPIFKLPCQMILVTFWCHKVWSEEGLSTLSIPQGVERAVTMCHHIPPTPDTAPQIENVRTGRDSCGSRTGTALLYCPVWHVLYTTGRLLLASFLRGNVCPRVTWSLITSHWEFC